MITDWEEVLKGVRMCLRKLSLHEAHDDLEQEAMLRAVTYQHTYRGEAQLSTWGYSIARAVAMAHFHKRKSELIVYDSTLCDIQMEASSDLDEELGEELVGEAEDLARTIIENVPPQWLPQLVDRDLHGMRYQAIAKKYGLPVGTICSSISRARDVIAPKIRELAAVLDVSQMKGVIRDAMERVHGHLQASRTRT